MARWISFKSLIPSRRWPGLSNGRSAGRKRAGRPFNQGEGNDMPTKTVLAVDDDPVMLELIKVTFNRAGYGFLKCSDGKGAIQAATQEHPDLIIMDIMLQDEDGTGSAKLLKD